MTDIRPVAPETDIEFVTFGIERLKWFRNDLAYKAPEQLGGFNSYLGIFASSLHGQILLLEDLLTRAKKMADSMPPSQHVGEVLKSNLPGWAGAVLWCKSLYATR